MSTAGFSVSENLHSVRDADADADEDSKIGNLPEEIISHILSLLPTKCAVATAVLSKKWRYRWASSITNLDLDDSLLYFPEKIMDRDTLFQKFVYTVLSVLGDLRVQQFHLSCLKGDYNQSDIKAWISSVFMRKPEKIKISCPRLKPAALRFTQDFNSTELKLHMNQSCSLKIPSSFTFSSLKVMDLNEISLLKEPISAGEEEFHLRFDVLEVLNLVNCKWKNVETINICSPKLRNLSIRDGDDNVMPDTLHEWFNLIKIQKKKYKDNIGHTIADVISARKTCDCSFKIQAPILDSFASCGFSVPDITLLGPATVVDLSVVLSYIKMSADSRILKNRYELLTEFSDAKSLTISSTIIGPAVDLPIFHNLIKLKIDSWNFKNNLIELLHCVPVLEFLTIVTRPAALAATKKVFKAKEGMIPQCVMSHLKIVQFDCCYYFIVQWIELPKYFLSHASVLEKFFIKCRRYEVNREKVEKELARLPKSCSGASVYLT